MRHALTRAALISALALAASFGAQAQGKPAEPAEKPEAGGQVGQSFEMPSGLLDQLLAGNQIQRLAGFNYLLGAYDSATSATLFLSKGEKLLACPGMDTLARVGERVGAVSALEAGKAYIRESKAFGGSVDIQPVGHVIWFGVRALAGCPVAEGKLPPMEEPAPAPKAKAG